MTSRNKQLHILAPSLVRQKKDYDYYDGREDLEYSVDVAAGDMGMMNVAQKIIYLRRLDAEQRSRAMESINEKIKLEGRPESRKIDSCRVRRKSAASMTSTKDVGEDAVVPAELEEEKEEDLMKEEDERKKQEEEKMKQEEEKKKQEEERKQQGEEMKRKQEQEKEQKRKEEQEKKEKEEEQKQEEQRKREEEERLKQEEDSDSDWEPEIGKTNWEEMRQNVKAERKKTDVKAALEDEDFKEFSEWIFSGEDDVKNVGQKMKFNI